MNSCTKQHSSAIGVLHCLLCNPARHLPPPPPSSWATGLANQKPYARHIVRTLPSTAIGAPDPLAQEKASLGTHKYGWTLQPGKKYMIQDRAGNLGVFSVQRYSVYYWGPSGGNASLWSTAPQGPFWEFQDCSFEIQLSDGSWYYPWAESSPDSGTPSTANCQHKPVNIGFMQQKWVCAHCDAEMDAETAIKLGGRV